MTTQKANKIYPKIALILALCGILLWAVLGTGTSLAWFSDETPEINNIFHFADFDVEVSYLTNEGEWAPLDGETDVFDRQARYEPGYVQVVYLKVRNAGDRDFKFLTAVTVSRCAPATNVFGQTFLLQDYLRFGVLSGLTEAEAKRGIPDRATAKTVATLPLYHYYESGASVLTAGETTCLALIVRMPEDVDNIANYRGNDVPTVDLGITVKAEQINAN
ncbi:MAG: hypothetical protein J6B54_01015 [Clostridia bacterium]|nr:hypothetical protein [Clostridia bacterium]